MLPYQPYNQLLLAANGNTSYAEQLCATEWQERRLIIMQRDEHCCTHCGEGETIIMVSANTGRPAPHHVHIPKNCPRHLMRVNCFGTVVEEWVYNHRFIEIRPANEHRRLHVHHSLYICDRLPWEYEDEHLVTLCEPCHTHWHEHNAVNLYEETEEGLLLVQMLTPCARCAGTGHSREYKHVDSGICFRCWGMCFEEWITEEHRKRSKNLYENFKKR